MKRVLLTGARGFIGRHCPALLRRAGYEVHAVSRAAVSDEHVRWHQVDLLASGTPASLIEQVRPTHLLHLAWYTEHGKFWSAPENEDWVRASAALIDAFAETGTRAVSLGTCAEYDWTAGTCLEESTPLAPSTLYGQCKHAAHVHQAKRLGDAGVSQAWARLFFPYGPGEPAGKLVASVVRSLLRGEEARCSAGEQVRDFIYVKDVASALVHLLESSLEGPVNVGSGVERQLREVVLAIARQLGREDLLRLGALPPREGDPPLILADVARLHGTGWRAEYDLERGLAETIASWRAEVAA